MHGIAADPDWTWVAKLPGNPSIQVNWLKDLDMLPQAVPNTRIMRFAYESKWLGGNVVKQRLWLIREQLLSQLAERRKVRS